MRFVAPTLTDTGEVPSGGWNETGSSGHTLLGRLLMVYIFLTSGVGKVFDWQGNVQYMNMRHLPMILVLLVLAAIVELGGSLCLITGFQARVAALIMSVYLAAVTLLFHNYWAFSGMLAATQETHFRKNLAIIGGLLIIASRGAGKWALGQKSEQSQDQQSRA